MSPAAYAGSTSGGGGNGGGGGGTGRLGQVSGGIGSATGAGGGGSSGHATGGNGNAESTLYTQCARYAEARERDARFHDRYYDERCREIVMLHPDGTIRTKERLEPPGNEKPALLTGYAGLEKVYDSNGSVSLALSVVDSRFRLNGSITHYYEDEMTGGRITMTMPELSLGVRLDPASSPTHFWLEGGVAIAKTQGDPNGNSSITGPKVGARVEHALSPRMALTGTAEGMFFPDQVKAFSARAAVRWNHVEAGVRVLDFNVGPALIGPEVGVGF